MHALRMEHVVYVRLRCQRFGKALVLPWIGSILYQEVGHPVNQFCFRPIWPIHVKVFSTLNVEQLKAPDLEIRLIFLSEDLLEVGGI